MTAPCPAHIHLNLGLPSSSAQSVKNKHPAHPHTHLAELEQAPLSMPLFLTTWQTTGYLTQKTFDLWPAGEEHWQTCNPNRALRAGTKAFSHTFASLQNKKSPGTIAKAQDNDIVSREEGKHSPCSQVDMQAV